MMRWRGRATVLAMVWLAGCGSTTGLELDMDLYDPIPQVGELEFGAIEPAEAWRYWELRFSWGASGSDSIVGSGGDVLREELAPEVREALDTFRPPTGFAGGCLPAWCFKFVAAVDAGDEIATFTTVDALRGFLAPIDSLEEAVLLLDAHPFYWHEPEQGIRERPGGWEAVVLELVRDCDPIQTDRVLVRVDRAGSLEERAREVWRRSVGACI